MARRALALTLELIEHMGKQQARPLLQQTAFLRPSRHAQQQEQFLARAKQHPQELSFGSFELDGKTFDKALKVHQAWIVNTPGYLESLEKYLRAQGCVFIEEAFQPEQVQTYEKVVIAAGAHTIALMQALSQEPLPQTLTTILTKGQLAICPSVTRPSQAINARAYIAGLPQQEGTLVGATFERTYTSLEPMSCPEREEIWKEAVELWPALSGAIAEWVSGVRLSGPDHLPFLASQQGRLFVLGALGSKGLLYHRLMAKRLATLMNSPHALDHWELLPLKTLACEPIF